MPPKTKNPERLNSKTETPISSVEEIKRNTIRQLIGPSWEERHEKIMEESENFMNELYKMSKEFTPTNEVFFEVKEENWTVKEITFRDLRKEPSWKRPAKNRDFLAGVSFLRSSDWSFFSLSTTTPTVYYESGGKLKHYTPREKSTSTSGYIHDLSDLLKQIQRKIEKINNKRMIHELTAKQRSKLIDVLSGKDNKHKKN